MMARLEVVQSPAQVLILFMAFKAKPAILTKLNAAAESQVFRFRIT